jgi:DNA polymerase (family 10)
MTNAEIAAVFEQVADLLEFQGANPFRVRAYRNAARTIHDLSQPVAALVQSDGAKLTEIQGIGADLAEKITTLVHTGSLPMLEEMLAQIPASVLSILRVPGLGPKRAAVLFRELGVSNLDQLREACEAHRVRELKGFGEKTETTILQGLEIAAQAEQRVYWAEADQVAQSLREHLAECGAIAEMEFAGSYRRGKDTVGDLDLLVVASDPRKVMDRFAAYPTLADVLARGDTKMSVRLEFGLQVDLRVVPAESFGAALQYFTGSKAHNVVLRGKAHGPGRKINENRVLRREKLVGGRTPEEG